MQNVNLQFEGISEADLETILADACLSPDAFEVSAPSRASGNMIVDVLVVLSHTELNALSLVIGYLLGKGVEVFSKKDIRKKIGSVSDAITFLKAMQKKRDDEDR